VGLKRWLGLDPSAPIKAVDPDAIVAVATLPLWQTPLVVKGLEAEDIVATFHETSAELAPRARKLLGIPAARIYVFQRDRARAIELITALVDDPQGVRLNP
jgi:hypothetical protein